LNRSQVPFCIGIPGFIRWCVIPRPCRHWSKALDVNPGPLSRTTTSGIPRRRIRFSRTRTTLRLGKLKSTSMPTLSGKHVHHVHGHDGPAFGQGIGNEVHGRLLVGPPGTPQRLRRGSLHAHPGVLSHKETLLVVEPSTRLLLTMNPSRVRGR